MLARLVSEVRGELARAGGVPAVAGKPVRLAPRPAFLAGREELLADLDARLAGGRSHGPADRGTLWPGRGGEDQHGPGVRAPAPSRAGVIWQFPAEEPTALAAGSGGLTAQLGARDLQNAGDPVAQVHAVLAARPGVGC
jgi:hypothetical protein